MYITPLVGDNYTARPHTHARAHPSLSVLLCLHESRDNFHPEMLGMLQCVRTLRRHQQLKKLYLHTRQNG